MIRMLIHSMYYVRMQLFDVEHDFIFCITYVGLVQLLLRIYETKKKGMHNDREGSTSVLCTK